MKAVFFCSVVCMCFFWESTLCVDGYREVFLYIIQGGDIQALTVGRYATMV